MRLNWAPDIIRRLTSGDDSGRGADIEIGDRFFQIGMGTSVWTVERICATEACDIPHVVIARSGPYPDSKILSKKTLADSSLYRRDRREPLINNESGKVRRHTDPPSRS